MLSVIFDECHDGCHYAKDRYGVCRGAFSKVAALSLPGFGWSVNAENAVLLCFQGLSEAVKNYSIVQHVLDTNAEKQLSYTVTDV